MADYINHVTLDTGHVRQSPRSEVGDHALAVVAAHLERAVATGEDRVPGLQYLLKPAPQHTLLLATLTTAAGAPLLTLGVAPRDRVAGRLWQMLTEGRGYAAHQPAAPWIAARIDDPERGLPIMSWMADYERLIAWAWLER
jgi:hypothetical protein